MPRQLHTTDYRQVLDALNKVNGFVVKDEHNAALLDANGEEALTLKKQ